MNLDNSTHKIIVVSLVCTDNFLPLGELLEYSWEHRSNSKYPFELLISSNVNIKDYAMHDEFHYKSVYNLEYMKPCDNYCIDNRFNGTLNKFWLYLLTDYEYVVFLDADYFISGNPDIEIDSLIESNLDKDFISTDTVHGKHDNHEIFGGFFITKPSVKTFLAVMELVTDVNKYNKYFSTDQQILNIIYSDLVDTVNTVELPIPTSLLHDPGKDKILFKFPEAKDLLINCSNEDYFKTIKSIANIIRSKNN